MCLTTWILNSVLSIPSTYWVSNRGPLSQKFIAIAHMYKQNGQEGATPLFSGYVSRLMIGRLWVWILVLNDRKISMLINLFYKLLEGTDNKWEEARIWPIFKTRMAKFFGKFNWCRKIHQKDLYWCPWWNKVQLNLSRSMVFWRTKKRHQQNRLFKEIHFKCILSISN